MKYSVKEIFLTIQGEGYNSGRKATFCRFSGCNLWNGLQSSKKTSKCNFCDTDFVGVDGLNGGKYTLSSLINKAKATANEPSLLPRPTFCSILLRLKSSFYKK